MIDLSAGKDSIQFLICGGQPCNRSRLNSPECESASKAPLTSSSNSAALCFYCNAFSMSNTKATTRSNDDLLGRALAWVMANAAYCTLA